MHSLMELTAVIEEEERRKSEETETRRRSVSFGVIDACWHVAGVAGSVRKPRENKPVRHVQVYKMADESSLDFSSWNWRREGRKRKIETEDDVEIVMIEKKVREAPQVSSNDIKFDEKFENDDDLDYAIALSLQESENREAKRPEYPPNVTSPSSLSMYDPRSIVDERWELEDPHPNIHELFVTFDAMFFERRLIKAGVAVSWGPRMTLLVGRA